jgi:hypothetical protein
MKTAIITNIFGPLEINRLALIIKEVAAGSSLLKLNTIEGRLISRVQLFEDLLLKVQKRRRKGGKK